MLRRISTSCIFRSIRVYSKIVSRVSFVVIWLSLYNCNVSKYCVMFFCCTWHRLFVYDTLFVCLSVLKFITHVFFDSTRFLEYHNKSQITCVTFSMTTRESVDFTCWHKTSSSNFYDHFDHRRTRGTCVEVLIHCRKPAITLYLDSQVTKNCPSHVFWVGFELISLSFLLCLPPHTTLPLL